MKTIKDRPIEEVEAQIDKSGILNKNTALDNEAVEALKALMYEEDDEEEMALGFYTQGNNILTKHILNKETKATNQKYFLRQALFKYNEAVELKVTDKELKSKIYCNRAMVHLKLKNYGKSINDCDEALKLNDKYVKAYYRKATALFNLDKYQEGLTVCEIGQKKVGVKELKGIKMKITNKIEELDQKKREADFALKIKENKLYSFFEKHGILYNENLTLQMPDTYQPTIKLVNDKLQLSVTFIYPEFNQFDFVKLVNQSDSIISVFATVYQQGLPWDENKLYTHVDDICFFVECDAQKPQNKYKYEMKKKSLKKIEFMTNIIDTLKTERYVVPKVLEVIVLSKKSAFYAHFIGRYN